MQSIEIGKGGVKTPYFQTMTNLVCEAIERIYYGDAGIEEALNEAAEELQEEISNQ